MHAQNSDFKRRLLLMTVGIVLMGIFQSFVIMANYGTDTCTYMNLSISESTGISFGTCCLVVNALLFVPVLIFDRSLIHIGTLMNMVLIGYISDFCRMLETKYLPAEWFTAAPVRPILFAITLTAFLIAIALYMNANLGQAPYDAFPTMLSRRLNLPYTPIRIAWDSLSVIIGFTLGRPLTVGVIIMMLAVGPTVTLIGKLLKRWFNI